MNRFDFQICRFAELFYWIIGAISDLETLRDLGFRDFRLLGLMKTE